MRKKAQYKTRQLDMLLDYLEGRRGEHITASAIHDYFKTQGVCIGLTTIYRHLERMVADGKVTKCVTDMTNGACFEYTGEPEECHESQCYHCKCDRCGKLIHLNCPELKSVQEHIAESHGFDFNIKKIVLHGICSDCRHTQ